jgi:hypothetical protein
MSMLRNQQPPLTPKEKLLKAQALIKDKRYADARRILRAVDHPTAREWLVKLDRIAPEIEEPDFDDEVERLPKKKSSRRNLYLVIIAVLVALIVVSFLNLREEQRVVREATRELIYNDAVRIRLQFYCEEESTKAACDQTVPIYILSHQDEIDVCWKLHNDTQLAEDCLRQRGLVP